MSSDLILELVGYLASALVAVSLMMTSVLRLRVINLIGSAVFSVYGLLIGAWPIVVVNAFIVVVNIVFLAKLLRRRDAFSLLEVDRDSAYLLRFLDFRGEDIAHFVPDFSYEPGDDQVRVFVLRDMVPAGLLIGNVHGNVLDVRLDYATPGYRDLKLGRYLYGAGVDFFRDHGIERFETASAVPAHEQYLERVGYRREGDRWVKPLVEVTTGR